MNPTSLNPTIIVNVKKEKFYYSLQFGILCEWTPAKKKGCSIQPLYLAASGGGCHTKLPFLPGQNNKEIPSPVNSCGHDSFRSPEPEDKFGKKNTQKDNSRVRAILTFALKPFSLYNDNECYIILIRLDISSCFISIPF